jgi:hypothetical protein
VTEEEHPMPTSHERRDLHSDAADHAAEGAGAGGLAPLATSRAALVADLLGAFASNAAYTAALGTDTDVTICSNPVHPSWGTGPARHEYAAALRADEVDRTVYFWEQIKGRSDETTGAAVGPGSTSWEWGYGTLRALIEEVAGRHGFSVKVVLGRHAASW